MQRNIREHGSCAKPEQEEQFLGQQLREPPRLGSSSLPSSWAEEKRSLAQLVPTWGQTRQARAPQAYLCGSCRRRGEGSSAVQVNPIMTGTLVSLWAP